MMKEASLSILQACNMIENSIMAGYPQEPVIRADEESLRRILDFISREIDRFRNMRIRSESVGSAHDEPAYGEWLSSPLRELEYSIKRVLDAADQEKGDLTNKLDMVKTKIRKNAMNVLGISERGPSEFDPDLCSHSRLKKRDSNPTKGKRRLRR